MDLQKFKDKSTCNCYRKTGFLQILYKVDTKTTDWYSQNSGNDHGFEFLSVPQGRGELKSQKNCDWKWNMDKIHECKD